MSKFSHVIEEQLKNLPEKSGVYLMKDMDGQIIYVGKAKILKNRVRSYFRSGQSQGLKVKTMVSHIDSFEYIITDSEVEALILEATLIKKHKPKYNILLRDDKTYPYIKVTVNEKFARVLKTRLVLKDGAEYFGPYSDVDAVNQTIDLINRVYPIRTCNRNLEISTERPCLNYHIGNCIAPCKKDVDVEEYQGYINEILKFLNGKYEDLLNNVKIKMESAAKELDFEKAALYRNNMLAIQRIHVKQEVVINDDINQDLISWARREDKTCIMIFFVRGGKLTGREKFILEDTATDDIEHILSQFLIQHYSGVNLMPKSIVMSDMPENIELLMEWLSQKAGFKVQISIPKRGEKRRAVELVKKNADDYIDAFQKKIEKDVSKINQLRHSLQEIFPDAGEIRRIEAYDISNIYGVLSVGSMVVFEDGNKKNSDYRRFKIKTIEGADDYASMMEILYRRFNRGLDELHQIEKIGVAKKQSSKFSVFPDLLLIDGGKGHVNSVLKVLHALDISIPVAGMLKDDRHKTSQLYYNGDMITIKSMPILYQYIASIQEEVHRFAVEYHRTLRTQQMTHSILDEIKGVGQTRKRALMMHFKSIDKLSKASLEEIEQVESITKKVAQSIYEFFRGGIK